MYTYSFEKLDVYQRSLRFSVKLRAILASFPQEERYGLTSQLRRAADSIPANIAEGSGRASAADQAHFTNMACSSALEVINHLNLAFLLGYIKHEDYQNKRFALDEIINKLNALYRFQLNNNKSLKNKVKK